jgi:V/A-type H+-transporting ATPase subunit I
MSIIPLNKVTVFGISDEKQIILEGLQKLGYLHLISLQPPPKTSEFVTAKPTQDARQALLDIMDVKRKRHQVRDESEFDTAIFTSWSSPKKNPPNPMTSRPH